jgi:hypothetical protein
MPYDPYDDPEIATADDEFPEQVSFERVGDKIRARVLSVEKITTRFGPTLKYRLFDGQAERSMLAGSKNLKGQMLELRPRAGDVLDVELIELRSTANGTAKIYDVKVEPGDGPAPPPPAPRSQPVAPTGPVGVPTPPSPTPGLAPQPRQYQDDGEDIFDR